MNPLREFPLLVVAAFPPNPTTSAVIIALLPPTKRAKEKIIIPFQTILKLLFKAEIKDGFLRSA